MTLILVVALVVGVPLGVYLGVVAYFTACEVFGMCKAYGQTGGPPWEMRR